MRRVTVRGNLKLFGSNVQRGAGTTVGERPVCPQTPDGGAPQSDEDEDIPVVIIKAAPAGESTPLIEEAATLVRGGVRPHSPAVDLLVSYDGDFLGIYHTNRRLSRRAAYKTVVAIVGVEIPDFDPAKLELSKVTPLKKPDSPEFLKPSSVGRFTRFDHQTVAQIEH